MPARPRLGPSAVLFAITDHVVDVRVAVTPAFEADSDQIESLVFVRQPKSGSTG